jgi:hypothetical protein
MNEVLERYAQDLESGTMITVPRARIRISRRP